MTSRRRGGTEWRQKKLNLFERENGKCFYCEKEVTIRGWSWPPKGSSHDDATLDHIIPKSEGGTNREDNLVLSCRECNEDKGVLSAEEYLLTTTLKI